MRYYSCHLPVVTKHVASGHFNFFRSVKILNKMVFDVVSRKRRRKLNLPNRRRQKKPKRRSSQRTKISRCRRNQQRKTHSLHRQKCGRTLGRVPLDRKVNRILQWTNQRRQHLLRTCRARIVVLLQRYMSEDRNVK